MPGKLRRWTPFFGLLAIVVISSVYLFYSQQTSAYIPATDDPARIYQEACASCHGEKGEGTGLLYPALSEEELSVKKIKKYITEGELFMPAFTRIKADTLDSLVQFVFNREYKK